LIEIVFRLRSTLMRLRLSGLAGWNFDEHSANRVVKN